MIANGPPSLWDLIWQDFAELGDAAHWVRVLVRLVFAAVLGGVVGWQRERVGKAAGLRTHMLVAMGSALFVLVAQQQFREAEPLSRIVQGIVIGVGFVG